MKHLIIILIAFSVLCTNTPVAVRTYIVSECSDVIFCPSQPCTTLDDLLLNNSLSNISNVEFKLLSGVYNVTSNILIQHVHNVSFIGVVDKSISVVLKCFYRASFHVIYSYNVTISHLLFEQCGGYDEWLLPISIKCPIDDYYFDRRLVNLPETYSPSLIVACCSFISLINITIQEHIEYGIMCYNMVGMSYLDSVTICTRTETGYGILLYLDDNVYTPDCDVQNDTIFVTNLVIACAINTPDYTFANQVVHINMLRSLMNVVVRNLVFIKYANYDSMIRITICSHTSLNYILITNCSFINNKQYGFFPRPVVDVDIYSDEATTVKILNCIFNSNKNTGYLVEISGLEVINISLINIMFNHNRYCGMIVCTAHTSVETTRVHILLSGIFINGTRSKGTNDFLVLIQTAKGYLTGNIYIGNNKIENTMGIYKSNVTFSGNITFFNNNCHNIIEFITAYGYIKVLEYSNIVFESNFCHRELIAVKEYDTVYPYCLFQYFASDVTLTALEYEFKLKLYSIKFISNYQQHITVNYHISYCRWLENATFSEYSVGETNKNIMHIENTNITLNKHINLCYCPKDHEYNCTTDILGYIFPGQTLQAELCTPFVKEQMIVFMYAKIQNFVIQNFTCKITDPAEFTAEVGKQPTTVNFTIASNRTDQCALFLLARTSPYYHYDAFKVQLLPCPNGFSILNGICDCDPYLVNSDLQINTCYINELAIQRPANSWIVHCNHRGKTCYSMSSRCPMDYCSPSTTRLNLEHSDSQCQFHRTGLLCSQCQNGFSMILGSSRCMRCTNVYLLLSIAVMIAGVVLVVLLYCLNLTVTKGTINGIIFYANVISINGSFFLANDNIYKPLKVFISFANLDLGIEACFYNGMDSYAKTWLQMFFPFYLIMLATTLIITSRYSTRIQRLTFARSLPVLATLFLLSYTGILRIVSTVLFSYSTVIELPSNRQHLIWSIDASVPLFGVKFTILFITCLILFVVLIPFNMTLLLTRFTMRFRIINRFKPLLDAFQGSYKHKHNYWIAVYITLRNILFVLQMLRAEVSLTVGAIILIIITTFYGSIFPYKSILVNVQELLLLINVTVIYSVSYHSSDTISSTVTNVMITIALVHFTIILLYHFLTFTCHCNVENMFWGVKEKMIKCCHLIYFSHPTSNYTMNSAVPERTYNYAEYREGLVTDDFKHY